MRRRRPELTTALNLARSPEPTLLIAKLDPLSRNAAFLPTLRDSDVRFVATDMPQGNDLTVRTMAPVAEQEREAISRRTGEALAAARARGGRLGNPIWRGSREAGWTRRCAAQGGHRAQRRSTCRGPEGGGRGHPCRRHHQPPRTAVDLVTGHNQYAAKACPGFHVPSWLANAEST